jgi:hypothetical protein
MRQTDQHHESRTQFMLDGIREMKVSALVVSSLLVFFTLAQDSLPKEPSWNLQVFLVDGSRIIGIPTATSLKVDVGFSELEIPLERIRRADFKDHGRTIRIELNNEDIISGTIQPEPVEIKTIFGKAMLPMKHFKAFEVRPTNLFGWLPTTRGLVLYYSFDRIGDGVVTNLAGNKHIGTLKGSTWTKDGYRGGAVEFNRSGRIEVPHDPDLCPETLTLAGWLKPHGDQSGYQVIAGKTESASWHSGYAFVRMPGNDKMLHFFVNGYTNCVAKTEMSPEGWSHVAGVCDGKNVTIYLNGKAMQTVPMRKTRAPQAGDGAEFGAETVIADETEPGEEPELECTEIAPSTSATVHHTKAPLMLGNDTRGYAWNGAIDELVLYRRALSAAEIQRLYSATAKQR